MRDSGQSEGAHFVEKLIGRLERGELNDRQAVEDLRAAATEGTLEAVDPIHFRGGGYMVHSILSVVSRERAAILQELGARGMEIFPTLVGHFVFGDYALMFTYISGTEKQDLLPYEEAFKQVRPEARDRAYSQLKQLVDVGLYIPWPGRGPLPFYMAPGDGHIVVCTLPQILGRTDAHAALDVYRNYLYDCTRP